jgi:hypothetical protein
MRRGKNLLVSRQRQSLLKQPGAGVFAGLEGVEQLLYVGVLEIVG